MWSPRRRSPSRGTGPTARWTIKSTFPAPTDFACQSGCRRRDQFSPVRASPQAPINGNASCARPPATAMARSTGGSRRATAAGAGGRLRSSRARRLVKLHENVSTTIFWIGEPASAENAFIANNDSAWDQCWKERYGGIDDPVNRNGFNPAGFTPNDNPFYVALPFNDLDSNGDRKSTVSDVVPWAKIAVFPPTDSAVKNRWLKIVNGTTTCYGQWEDVGPFNENDHRYVFGLSRPRNATNSHAGLDVSPAVRDCLHINDGTTPTTWRFVEAADVPNGQIGRASCR